jgi:DNA-binding winged helix-turn-helix (wHTH) protein
MEMRKEETIVFPPFQLDTANERLYRGSESITLRPKAFDLLFYLLRHPNQLATKQELLEACWPGTVVTDTVLKVCIREIREVLHDDPKSPSFIETVHRRGYRFIGQIEQSNPDLRRDQRPLTSTAASRHSGYRYLEATEIGSPKALRPGDSGRLVLRSSFLPSPRPSVALVGRESSLARLRSCLALMRCGDRKVVFITGEAGIGKTSLVEVFLQEAVGDSRVLVARGHCLEQYGSGEAYLPVLEAISRLCDGQTRSRMADVLRRNAPTWLQQMPWLMEDSDWESLQRSVIGATRERMLREMADALESLTSDTPLVLVLEDLHWSDYSTLDLVSYVARRPAPAQLMILATYRPVDVAISDHPLKSVKQELQSHRQCEEIPLEYLQPDAVRLYLNARYSEHQLPAALGELLHQRTDGNPFFLVNAVDLMESEGLIAKANSHWTLTAPLDELEMGVPESIRQMIEKQIGRLDPEQQRVLEAAAVAGVEFSTSAVAAGLEQTILPIEEQCEQLARRQLFLRVSGESIYPDGLVTERYAFIHSLYQEVLYQRISGARRARIHLLIGERGEELYGEFASEVAAELAMHFEMGRDYRRAVKYLRHAAQNHLLRYANREALAYLNRALNIVNRWPPNERDSERMAILEQSGLARRAMGDMAGSSEDFEQLAKYAAELNQKEDEVKALSNLATVLSWVDRERCLTAAARSLELSNDIDNQVLQSHVRGGWGYWHVLFLGWGDEHKEAVGAAVASARAAGNAETLGLHLARYSYLQCLNSDYENAVKDAEEAARLGLETGDAHSYLLAQYFEAWALLHAGRWGEMRQILDHGLEMATRNQHTRWAVLFLLQLGWLHEQCFDFEVALQMCRQAHEQAVQIKHPYTELLGLILMGLAHRGLNDLENAFRCLNEAVARFERDRILMDWILRIPLHYALSLCWLSRGDAIEARRQAHELFELAAQPRERTYLALAHLALAESEILEQHPKNAFEQIEQSRAVIGGAKVPLAECRISATAARVYGQQGQAEEALLHQNRALEVLNELARSLDETDRLRHSLLSSAVMKSLIPSR